MNEPRAWHARGYLPHYDDGRSIQTITYRLADALPCDAVQQLEEQTLDDEERRAVIEHYLDAGHGTCELRDPAKARAVLQTWRHSEDIDYRLHAWVIMPNHVHVMIEPGKFRSLGAIIGAWKSISTRKILRIDLEREGLHRNAVPDGRESGPAKKRNLWQADYYDRFIRDERHYQAAVDYIQNNPVKARLVTSPSAWPWSSAAL